MKSFFGWTVYAIGIVSVGLRVALLTRTVTPGQEPLVLGRPSFDHSKLLGLSVKLPPRDAFGSKLSDQSILLISIDCMSCSTDEGLERLLALTLRYPLLVVTKVTTGELPKLLTGGHHKVNVLTVPESYGVPRDMLDHAPVAALLNEKREIVKVASGEKCIPFLEDYR